MFQILQVTGDTCNCLRLCHKTSLSLVASASTKMQIDPWRFNSNYSIIMVKLILSLQKNCHLFGAPNSLPPLFKGQRAQTCV